MGNIRKILLSVKGEEDGKVLKRQQFTEEGRRKNTIIFIEAAKALLDEEGIGHVSVRKIAQRAGFHNSTIYLYFSDLDELILLASLKYFKKYSALLATRSDKSYSPKEDFLFIWESFFDCFLEKPCIFSNFFFGRRSHDLSGIIEKYYDLYPKESETFTEIIRDMYFGKNILERSFKIMLPLIQCKSNVREDNIHMLTELTVSYCRYKLEEGCRASESDLKLIKSEAMRAIRYLAGV